MHPKHRRSLQLSAVFAQPNAVFPQSNLLLLRLNLAACVTS